MASNAFSYNYTIATRGSDGLSLLNPKTPDLTQFVRYNNFLDESKNCRVMAFNSSGKLFAYSNGLQVKLINVDTCEIAMTIDRARTSYISFSPLGNYLVLWEQFIANQNENQNENNNLNIYDVRTKQIISSIQQRKQSENYIQWSNDEQIFSLLINGVVRFYETKNPSQNLKFIQAENLSSFSMHPASKCIAVHIVGKKNQPSSIRLFQYPNVTETISNKSFFNADKVEMKWNRTGSYLLILCSTETSASSYYGDTTLHYMNVSGESLMVTLSKKGPIYSLEWNPNRDEFIVVYGAMPAKATLFNHKCDAIFDFGTGARNDCFFNSFGNIVCLCGFGNIRGRIEVWNLSTHNRVPEQICSIAADDTTYFEWCPDGEHILTATLSPRLRVSNGYKIWNYIGENKYSVQLPNNGELWQATWKPSASLNFRPIIIKKPAVTKEEVKAYVPPHLRGKNQESTVKSKLHEDDEKPDTALKIKIEKDLDPEATLQKKIKGIKKKLQQIDELKKKKASGTKLEANQLEKISAENDLIEELQELELNAK